MKTDRLIYSPTKHYSENGTNYFINVRVRLDDECKNKICEFAVTAEIWRETSYAEYIKYYTDRCEKDDKYYVMECGGCCHEDILKVYPKLKPFVDLHLVNHYGHRHIDNGMYYFQENEDDTAMKILSITKEEAEILKPVAKLKDKFYFQYLIEKMGIMKRWNEEADKTLKYLEKLTGDTWVNPYSKEEERFVIKPLSKEKIAEIEQKEKEYYYTRDNILSIINKREEEKRVKARQDIIDSYEKKINSQIIQREIDLLLFDKGIKPFEAIYYIHSNHLCFNWSQCCELTQEQYTDFVNGLTEEERKRLPQGCEISYKNI